MLQVVDKRAARLLALADYLEGLDPRDFDMSDWCSCVAGHCLRQLGYELPEELRGLIGDNAEELVAATLLGLTRDEAWAMFRPAPADGDTVTDGTIGAIRQATPREAARMLRRFVVGGVVAWD